MRYQWKKLLDLPGSHRYYQDELTGRYALADRSGSFPDTTEDGVLWLDLTRPLTVSVITKGRPGVSVPLVRTDGDVSATFDGLGNAIEIARFWVEINGLVEMNERDHALVTALSKTHHTVRP